MSMHKHPFIVIEGIDGTGKTTVSKELAKRLGGLWLSMPPAPYSTVRQIYDHGSSMAARYLYYLSALLPASEQIESALRTQAVVCDRFILSTLHYHEAMGVDVGAVDIYRLPICWPDHNVCLTVDEAVRRHRIKERAEQTHSDPVEEQYELLAQVDSRFRQSTRYVVDTTTRTPSEVTELICDQLGLMAGLQAPA